MTDITNKNSSSSNSSVMKLLHAIHDWKTSGCSASKAMELRSLINQSRSADSNNQQQQIERLLKRIDLFAIYKDSRNGENDSTIENFRLLRDVTRNKDAQEQAVNSGVLARALELVCSPDVVDYDLQRVLLGFIANCSSFPKSWSIINSTYDFAKSIGVHPDCASMTAYNVYVLPGNGTTSEQSLSLESARPEPPVSFCEIIPKLLLLESGISTDAQFWLSEVLESILRKKELNEVLQLIDEAILIDLIRNDYLFTDESMERNIDALSSYFQSPFSVAKLVLMAKFAQHACDHPFQSSAAEKILRLAVAEMKRMGRPASTAEDASDDVAKTTGMWLRIIANILNQAEIETKILFREIGGIPLLLANTNLDVHHPTKREWALFAIRGLCENNPDAQEYIANLQVVKAEEMQNRASVIHTTL